MEIILEDGPLKDTVRTHDAVKAFSLAVANGQSRLAMEILVPIINALTNSSSESVEDLSPNTLVSKPEIKNGAKTAAVKSRSARQKEAENTEK